MTAATRSSSSLTAEETKSISSESPSTRSSTSTGTGTGTGTPSRGNGTIPSPPRMKSQQRQRQQQQPSPSPSRDATPASSTASSVQVAVRVRPLLAWEAGTDNCIEVLRTSANSIDRHPCALRIGGTSGPSFTFDHVFDITSPQGSIFDHRVAPLVERCLEGYNATILAYGQTGSGKTYTIMGPSAATADQDDSTAGVIPRAIRSLFRTLEQQRNGTRAVSASDDTGDIGDTGNGDVGNGDTTTSSRDSGGPSPSSPSSPSPPSLHPVEYDVRVQFLELYGEEIRDLLVTGSNTCSSSVDKLTIRDVGNDEPEVVGATQRPVGTAEDALKCLTHGMLRRVTAATAMNEGSSRSHAILSILVEQSIVLSANNSDRPEEHVQVRRSKFNFVDLAGSERQKRTQASGKRLKEGIDINKGLLVLGNVISALGDPKKRGKTFVPYRDSKLTRLLKGSLGGNHKTLMIACVSPSSDNMDETLNCLRYANRAKNIQNNAIVNVDASSQLLTELKGQVRALARDLIRVKDGDITAGSFTREALEAMAEGAGASVPAVAQISTTTTSKSVTPRTFTSADSLGVEEQLRQTEIELSRTREFLGQSQRNHDAAEEQLYVAKAEKQLFQLQVSVLTDDSSVTSMGVGDKEFLAKATDYEKEIGKLRDALRTVKAKADRMALIQGELMDDDQTNFSVERAKKALDEDKKRLSSLRSTMSLDESDPDLLSVTEGEDESQALDQAGRLDTEAKAEEAEINALTNKYLDQGGYMEDDDPDSTAPVNNSDAVPSLSGRQQGNIQADLIELSRGIAAKEDLIDQLKLSQEKYASMRDFYEDKLKIMEDSLREKEMEREQLVRDLELAKESSVPSEELESQLREKENHIANLKKKQKELKDLTSVSSRNDSEITRLQTDVRTMKHKKVSLQKQIVEERKAHANEMKNMIKAAIQKDREVSKWKKVSSQSESQAQKSNQVAKARLEELGHLRTKYKDAEKRLRTLSLKRGVMAKAGLDPVIVGRRDSDRGRSSANIKDNGRLRDGPIDADLLRDHFDQKVAEVARKEAIADKLAQEWEEHFELTTRREELALQGSEEKSGDAFQSLSVQIQFKEDRIRHLAQRLGKQQLLQPASNASSIHNDSFLYDQEFGKICKGTSSELAKSTAARILFGMIVRERRRIAALARTASALDEKLQAASKAAEASEAALRSYVDDQRHEFAALSQTQQEQILALMDMVRDDKDVSALKENFLGQGESSESNNAFDPKLFILSNERIKVLEHQLEERQSESNANDSYRIRLGELATSLETKSRECEDLQEELTDLRGTLRQIRDVTSKQAITDSVHESGLRADVLEIVRGALHTAHTPSKVMRRSPRTSAAGSADKPSRHFLSPRLKKHVELMHTSDSGEDTDAPEWAADIMADLALIAEGKTPTALENSPLLLEVGPQPEQFNVFDRLNDPLNFTGVQKQVRSKQKDLERSKRSKSPSHYGQEERKAMSREIADRLDKIVVPGAEVLEAAVTPLAAAESTKSNDQRSIESKSGRRSVFDRLVSPSQYTGTQKGKFQNNQAKRDQAAEDVAERLLDNLLNSSDTSEPQESSVAKGVTTRSMLTDYTEQDVFERLQRTATQSYALKHNGTMLPDTSFYDSKGSAASIHDTPEERKGPLPSEPLTVEATSSSSGYKILNVFERLQKTTTEAFAKKINKAT